jgi:hypothetical protein
MKKFLMLLVLAACATTAASMQAAGSSPRMSPHADDVREARACAVLLKRMARSAEADNWRNRMLAWTCMQRADRAVVASAELDG